MKVYVAQGDHDYEGFVILGVYATERGAKAAIAHCEKLPRKTGDGCWHDGHSIEEYEMRLPGPSAKQDDSEG